MDMSLEDTLAVLGLDDEAYVFPSTGRDRGGHFFNISRGQSENSWPRVPTGVTWTLSGGPC